MTALGGLRADQAIDQMARASGYTQGDQSGELRGDPGACHFHSFGWYSSVVSTLNVVRN